MERLIDLDAAATYVARELRPPFPLYSVGPAGGALRVTVPVDEVAEARRFFDLEALRLANGTLVSVEVEGRYGDGWSTFPITGPAERPGSLDAAGVQVGLPVQEASLRANAAGWIVRAHEPEAFITADLRMNRVNLVYDAQGTVTALRVG